MANLTRFDPVGEMVSLRAAMDRLFEDSFVSPMSWRTLGNGETITPPIDVHETADELVVTSSLPGIRAEDLEITMTGQTLTLRGEFKADDEIKREQYLYRERRYGTFGRTVQLPVRVQGDRAEASFNDGILTLRLPKAEEVRPRQIRITANAAENTEAESKES
jgi:HSP20 family protein